MGEPDDYKKAEMRPYQRLIGQLMCLLCGTCPDIAFVVGQLSRHNADPRLGHMRAAKRVVRCLKGSMHLGLICNQSVIGQENNEGFHSLQPFGLIGYADSNFAGDPKDCKSVMRYCFFMAGVLLIWSSKKQRTVSSSTIEAEYIALGYALREGV